VTAHTDHHATIFVTPGVAGPIESLRRAWDPAMASQIAAHVTLAYPREAPIVELLVERVRIASAWVAPFRLRLGNITHAGRPEDGVYVEVEDVDGGYRALREDILRPPFTALPFTPHATLVHPRTSTRGRECWEATGLRALGLELTAPEISITAFDGRKWDTLETFPLLRDG
jgi:2'-5' RNA ligase